MKTILLSIAIIFGICFGFYVSSETLIQVQVQETTFDIAATIKKHAYELASDKYSGREAGSGNDLKAAEYVASQFKAIGLKPMGTEDYFQKFRFTAWWNDKSLETVNVIGMIDGTDLKHEIVVIGAHYDHVGTLSGAHYGQYKPDNRDDVIFNGADDNASGTSTLITIATMFKSSKIQPRRTVLFIAFGAEEGGLFGSKYYCNKPTISTIANHTLMINLDMIGRNPDKPVEVTGVGTIIGDTLREAVKVSSSYAKLSVNIVDRFKPNGGDSDHSSFNDVGVPNIFFFTGLHADYHRVSDHSNKLDYNNMAKIAVAVLSISQNISSTTDILVYLK